MYLVCWVFKGVRNTVYQCSLSLLCELCLQPLSQIHTLEICGNNRKCHWLALRWWQVGVLGWDTTFLAPPCQLDEVAVTLGWSWSPVIGRCGGKPIALLGWVLDEPQNPLKEIPHRDVWEAASAWMFGWACCEVQRGNRGPQPVGMDVWSSVSPKYESKK